MSKAVVAQVVGFVAFVVVLIVGARALAPDDGRGDGQGEAPVVAAEVPTVPMAPRADAARGAPLRYAQLPPTALPPLFVVRDGKPLALAGPRDKPALLHLWATWCGPCIKELPAILAYGRQGSVEVIAVSVDDHFESIQKYFQNNLPAEVAWDQKITLEPTLGVRSLPTTFLIDRQGRARLRWNGMQDWSGAAMNELIVSELARALPAP